MCRRYAKNSSETVQLGKIFVGSLLFVTHFSASTSLVLLNIIGLIESAFRFNADI